MVFALRKTGSGFPDHPSSKCVQRLQSRWPVKGGRVGRNSFENEWNMREPTRPGEHKEASAWTTGATYVFFFKSQPVFINVAI